MYMYVPHLEFLANKGAEIEMSARSRFLGSRLGVLDRDAPLLNTDKYGSVIRTCRGIRLILGDGTGAIERECSLVQKTFATLG
jgi:hypothetical protein